MKRKQMRSLVQRMAMSYGEKRCTNVINRSPSSWRNFDLGTLAMETTQERR
jgi:hypothetical protein